MRKQRNYAREFQDYQDFIVHHENYEGLPNKFSATGKITWVKVGDKQRAQWWDSRVSEMGLADRSSVARAIHPPELNGYKPCQICGENKNINYVYPNKITLQKINQFFAPLEFEIYNQEIGQIVDLVHASKGDKGLYTLAAIFGLKNVRWTYENLAQKILQSGKQLSPGVMSNAPDRLDGFHTYNACCRPTEDKGRSKSNLARYQSDRRAYENWADGDWRGADRLMGKFLSSNEKLPCPRCKKIAKMTPDHIGPLSLGFNHRMRFQPLCKSCNSKKNNRMTFDDVQILLTDERAGLEVISWHSKHLWDLLKREIHNENQANSASAYLREQLHVILLVFAYIYEKSGEDYLARFLNPQFAYYDFYFSKFEPLTGEFQAEKFKVVSEHTKSLAKRYIRISFKSLGDYAAKKNRKKNSQLASKLIEKLEVVIEQITQKNYESADLELDKIFKEISTDSFTKFLGHQKNSSE